MICDRMSHALPAAATRKHPELPPAEARTRHLQPYQFRPWSERQPELDEQQPARALS